MQTTICPGPIRIRVVAADLCDTAHLPLYISGAARPAIRTFSRVSRYIYVRKREIYLCRYVSLRLRTNLIFVIEMPKNIIRVFEIQDYNSGIFNYYT